MREETRARLETLMARYEKRLADERKRHEATRRRHDAFVAEFERLIAETIRPAMEDVGDALRRRGHDADISTTQAYSDLDGRPRSTQVTMRVYPAGIQRSLFTSTSTPHIAFVCDWPEARITVRGSVTAPGTAPRRAAAEQPGKRADYYAKQVTGPAVEREIVEVLSGVFGRGRVLDGDRYVAGRDGGAS
jgi:hypothetical protein